MKRKRSATCLDSSSSSQQQQQLFSSPKSTVIVEAVEDDFCLPDDCLELVFKLLLMDEDNNSKQYHRKLNSLSVVSKQFLYITSRFRLSICIYDKAFHYLPPIFPRYTNLNSLELRCFYGNDNIDKFLRQLFGFNPISLDYERTIPANGLGAFSRNITTLTSLTCVYLNFLENNTNMYFIAHFFPNLQRLDLNGCYNVPEDGICHLLKRCNIRYLNLAYCFGVKLHGMNFETLKLEVLNLSYTSVDDETLYVISKNCRGLLQLSLQGCFYVTEKGVKYVVENCTQLREINLKDCKRVHANVVKSMVSSRPSLSLNSTLFSFQ